VQDLNSVNLILKARRFYDVTPCRECIRTSMTRNHNIATTLQNLYNTYLMQTNLRILVHNITWARAIYMVSGHRFPAASRDVINSPATLNIKCGLRPCTEKRFSLPHPRFYAEFDSLNNSYQWKSPLTTIGILTLTS